MCVVTGKITSETYLWIVRAYEDSSLTNYHSFLHSYLNKQTVKDSRVVYGGGHMEVLMAKVSVLLYVCKPICHYVSHKKIDFETSQCRIADKLSLFTYVENIAC